ncbi:MAG: hypothetical protein ACJ71R_17070 [Nitrososphaeraceae archaeon]
MISTVTPTGGMGWSLRRCYFWNSLYCKEGYNKEEGADIQNMTSTCTQINEK